MTTHFVKDVYVEFSDPTQLTCHGCVICQGTPDTGETHLVIGGVVPTGALTMKEYDAWMTGECGEIPSGLVERGLCIECARIVCEGLAKGRGR